MHWIKEVVIAKSNEELLILRSIVVRNAFPDHDMLDAMIASALTRLLDKHIYFHKRASVEEQADSFLRGRQIAYMIYEHFRATGAYEAVQGLSDLLCTLAEWRRPRLRRSMGSSSITSKRHASRCDPGRIVQVTITGLCSASDSLGETVRNNGQTSYSYWSHGENSKLQSSERSWKKSSHQESKRERKPTLIGKWECFSVEGTWTMFKRRLM